MDQHSAHKAKIAAQFIGAIPFSKALGMELTEIGEGRAVIVMPWDARIVGDPRSGVVHGGAVTALMDTCSGAAVMAHPEGASATATIDLRIDYMRAARTGHRITAEAICHHVTRSVAFVRAQATDEDAGAGPVATATGVFTFERDTRVPRKTASADTAGGTASGPEGTP
ncbi:MAG: PaaI family thioesterase [Pseudomonadota bacterium]